MERTYTLRDMLAALRRRKWLASGVALVVVVAGAVVIAATPDEYRSEAVMQVEPHQIPADFFPSSVTSFEERMRTLKHGVLARPVLERVLAETDFYPDWRRNPDEALDRLRRSTEVRLEGEVGGGPPALLFVVEVRGRDREKVAKAANLIPTAYAELTRQVMQRQAENLRRTLDEQLAQLTRRLTAEEQRLVAFHNQHTLELPDANDANQRAAATIVAQIEARRGSIADARRRRAAILASIPEAFSDAGLAGGNAEEVLRRLEAARATYGPEHPDVKRLERQYQEASGRSSDQSRRFEKERIQAQLARLDQETKEDEASLQQLEGELAAIQKRLEAAPRWGEQFRVLSRDYETVRGKYASTLSRASDAAAAQQLLAADGPDLFRMVQPAVTPTKPAGPNRGNLGLVALAAALGAAILATAFAEYFDSSLRGPQDANAFGVPVLASIPRIGPRRGAVR